jgi:hypothetical protein
MKKLVVLFVALSLCAGLSLAACSKSEQTPPPAKEEAKPAPAPATDTAAPAPAPATDTAAPAPAPAK